MHGDDSVAPELKLALAHTLHGYGAQGFALRLAEELSKSTSPNVGPAADLLAARIFVGLGLLEPGSHHLQRVIRERPTERSALILASRVALGRQEAATARGYLQTVLEENPEDAEATYLLGTSYLQSGDLADAAELFANARELNPDNGFYHYGYGQAVQGQGRKEDAKAAYEKALEHLPRNYEILTRLGLLAHEQEDYEEAAKHYRLAVAVAPDKAFVASNNLAELMVRKRENPPLALALAYTSYANSPRELKGATADTYARVLIEVGNPAAAVAPARLAAALDRTKPGRLLRLGVAEMAAGNEEDALAALKGVMESDDTPEAKESAAKLIKQIQEGDQGE
jgi:tetratricopeptide (TPR) repeat protein